MVLLRIIHRMNSIVNPMQAIPEKVNAHHFTNIMVHELSHDPDTLYDLQLREKLYQTIGFTSLNGELQYPAKLKNRLLLNPDGINNQICNARIYSNTRFFDSRRACYFFQISGISKYNNRWLPISAMFACFL